MRPSEKPLSKFPADRARQFAAYDTDPSTGPSPGAPGRPCAPERPGGAGAQDLRRFRKHTRQRRGSLSAEEVVHAAYRETAVPAEVRGLPLHIREPNARKNEAP
jgi:hypothetical protein